MTIDTIRQLLVKYYEGDATIAETAVLKSFFNEAKELPEDLTTDAAIFRAMTSHENTDYIVPKDLREKIVSKTIRRSRRVFHIKSKIGAVASLAVLICLSIVFITQKTAEPYQQPLSASIGTPDYFDVPDYEELPSLQTIATNNIAVNNHENHCHEITDSAEVVEITQQILEKINRSLNKAEYGIKYAEASVDIFNRQLNYSTYTITINL